jgi:hypothetical protein
MSQSKRQYDGKKEVDRYEDSVMNRVTNIEIRRQWAFLQSIKLRYC